MIAEPTSNDAVMHHRLVGLVLEIRLPAILEVWRRPRLELLELLGRGANLDTGIDTVRGEGASALEGPFIKDSYIRYQ